MDQGNIKREKRNFHAKGVCGGNIGRLLYTENDRERKKKITEIMGCRLEK